MAFVPGNFSASQLGAVVAKEGEFLEDGRINNDLRRPIVAGAALLQHQDPNVDFIYASNAMGENMKCVNAKVSVLRSGDTIIADPDIECEIPQGPQAGSEALQLEKEVISVARFTVWDKECTNAFTFEDIMARHSLAAKVQLEVDLSKKLIAFAAANADVPVASWFETAGTVVGNSYNVTAANWKPELYADVLAAAQISDIYDPIMVNGRNFYNDTFMAQFKGVIALDNDGVLTNTPWQVFFDLQNVDQVTGAKTTLITDRNSLLFISLPEYMNMEPMLMQSDTYTWGDTLPRLQYRANGTLNPIGIDVRAKRVCQAGVNYGWAYEYVIRGNLKAMLPNADGRKGIIKITQVP